MTHFNVFSNCTLTKGHSRSLISDLQRNNILIIPDDMYKILTESKEKSISEIVEKYGKDNEETIIEYYDTLVEEELGFYCNENELQSFPYLSTEYRNSSLAGTFIIENIYDVSVYIKLLEELEKLRCESIEIIFYDYIENSILTEILNCFFYSYIKNISISIKYDEAKTEEYLKFLSSTKLRLDKILLHSCTEEKILDFTESNNTLIIYTNKKIQCFHYCGNVSPQYFSINIEHFTESLNHNTCLHKKISIDKDGNIKNCPSMSQSFGNIKDTTLEEALNHPDFKKYWNVTKDQIEVCKDCEFRHICTDCRAYTERTHFNEDIDLSKPLKCGYNPYTNEWAEWSTNPLKQQAIEYYGMQELVKLPDVK
jgi:SPASM domain peptide maturase of grasp-with-spasm system